jgi:hypothetical protein
VCRPAVRHVYGNQGWKNPPLCYQSYCAKCCHCSPALHKQGRREGGG